MGSRTTEHGTVIPILRVPPFPHALRRPISRSAPHRIEHDTDIAPILATLVEHRVGGCYWGSRPALPVERTIVAKARNTGNLADLIDRMVGQAKPDNIVAWLDTTQEAVAWERSPHIAGDCDPWHIIDRVTEIWCDADDELALLAAAAGRKVRVHGTGRFAALDAKSFTHDALLACARTSLVETVRYTDPFTYEEIDANRAIALSSFWRRLIDSNRSIYAAAGIAFWKRDNVEALLWAGRPVHFIGTATQANSVPEGSEIAVWRSRTSPQVLAALDARKVRLIEVEDGFIRSAGLGADCVPPSSILVDRSGAHFDPSQPSDLEALIERDDSPAALLDRADKLAALIVASGVSKYGAAGGNSGLPPSWRQGQRRVLVPGQVEDDRSVRCGGGEVAGNLDLLRRVRTAEPAAFIIYKPHPDIEAGHRKGHVHDAAALQFADVIIRNASIASLLGIVDAVHVLTSLVGFEALLRGKEVTTHGTPFYAGWGLTRDLGSMPSRRHARPTLSQLTAAVLLQYPRYLDPVSRLPCPPEILVEWLASGEAQSGTKPLVLLRRIQGRITRSVDRLAGRIRARVA